MLDDHTRELAKGKNFAAFTTLFADGSPQTTIVWVDADDEHVLVNTEVHRPKYKNTKRDGRVALAIVNGENPYDTATVRGRVVGEVRGPEARRHIDELSERYTGAPYAVPIESERVILKILPEASA